MLATFLFESGNLAERYIAHEAFSLLWPVVRYHDKVKLGSLLCLMQVHIVSIQVFIRP